MTHREKIAALSAAISAVRQLHPTVPGINHTPNVISCECEYGALVKSLTSMRREAYVAVQSEKVVKETARAETRKKDLKFKASLRKELWRAGKEVSA